MEKTEVRAKPALLRRKTNRDWLAEARQLDWDSQGLDICLAKRYEVNPLREQAAWEGARHRAAFGAGWVFSAIVGAVIGLFEAVGIALGRAVARQPLIVGTALFVFIATLVAQTYLGGSALSLRLIGQFAFRAAWAATLTALAGSVAYGIWQQKKGDE